MQSQVTNVSPTLVEVKVEVPWDRVKKDLDASFQKLTRQAHVRGFRPGKVPEHVVRQLFGAQVKSEITAALVEEGLIAAVQKHELQLVARPEVEAPAIASGEPLTFTAKVEVRPKIDHVDLTKLELVRTPAEVTDAMVNDEVESLRRQHAELRAPAQPRPGQASDVLTIDYAVTIDGKDRAEMGATGRQVELGADRLIPEFEKGLVGQNAGAEVALEVKFAADHGNEDIRGKTAEFKIKIHDIRERVLPDVDDEFAKDCGDYETLLELRLELRKRLESAVKAKGEAALKEQLIDRLVAANPVPVPESLVRAEEHQMMMGFAAFARMAGQAMPASEELHAETHGRAERRVRAALLFGAVAREQGVMATEADVEAHLADLAAKTGKHIAKLRAEHQGEKRETLEAELLEQKLMNYLMGQASILDGPAAGAEEKPTEEASTAKPKRSRKAKSIKETE